MKIGIVGGGTGGIVSAMECVARSLKWTKVDLIYDPELPILGVGESLAHDFVLSLREATQYIIPFDNTKLNSTQKLGVCFADWAKSQDFPETLKGYLPNTCQGLHVDTYCLRDFVLPRIKHYWGHKFNEVHVNVKDIIQDEKKAFVVTDNEKLEYDYVMDCRGLQDTIDDTYESVPSTVNAVVLNQCEWPGDWNWTYHIAHKDGWMFGIPLYHRSSWGYLFNSDVTPVDEAITNSHEFLRSHRIPKQHIDYNHLKDNLKVIQWKPYHSKKIVDGRIMRNGAKVYQYEPLHGYSVPMFRQMSNFFLEYVMHQKSEKEMNDTYHYYLNSFRDLIAFHYHRGSIYDTPFWSYIKKVASNQLDNSDWMRICLDTNFDLEGAVQMEDIWSTSVVAHPMFIWELDKAFDFHYFDHLPDHL